MTESSRRGPEKQRAPLAPSREPLLPDSREAEEVEARAAATAVRATLAAAGAASGPPPGITPSTALSLARRVGNRRFGQWAARQRSAQGVAGQHRPGAATGDDSHHIGHSPDGQLVAGATAIVTPPFARSRSAMISRAWDETGIKLGPELKASGTMPNPFEQESKKWGPELTPSGTMPNPFEEQGRKWGPEIGPSGLMPNPFGDTKATAPTKETAVKPATAPLTPSGLMPNPFGDSKATGPTTESQVQANTPLTPSGLRSNPFGDSKATGPTTESEVQATVGDLQAESTALGGTTRQAEVSGGGPAAPDQAPALAAEGRGQTAEADATSRDEAARVEEEAAAGTVTSETAPGPETAGTTPEDMPPGALTPEAEQALARTRQLIESAVMRVIGMLNPVGAVLSALNAIHNVVTEMASSLSRVVTPVWEAVSGAIRGVISFVTRQASSLLASARAAALRVLEVVTSTLGGAAEAVMGRIRALQREAYARVVQMVQSARQRGIARLTGLVTGLLDRIRATGEQIRQGIAAAVAAVVAAIHAARAGARGEMDRLLGTGASGRQVGTVRARLRAWARRRLLGLSQIVSAGRAARTVSALRTALFAVVGHIGLLWEAAQGAFSETFAEPLAQAREHVPELVGEVGIGVAQAEGQLAQPGPVADLELALVEREMHAAAAQLMAEAEETGSTL